MLTDNNSNDLCQNSRREDRHAQPSPPLVAPVRFANYEADVSHGLAHVQNVKPSSNSVPNDLPDNRDDLSGIRQALEACRGQPDFAQPASHKPGTQQLSFGSNAVDHGTTDQSGLNEPAKEQKMPTKFGGTVSDKSRKLIERIAYNTLFVLILGVGFIFVAKKWLKPGGAAVNQVGSDFEVLNTLSLPGKSNLLLVKVDDERLLVAIDPAGIKSVLHLTDSFAEKLGVYEESMEQSPVIQAPKPQLFAEHMERVSKEDKFEKKKSKTRPPQRTSNAAKNTVAIEKQMEAALKKFGLAGRT